MEFGLSMDNDSGYVSHHPESNLDSSSENMNKVPSFDSQDIFMSEDAHLEQPILRGKCSNLNFRQDSFDSVIATSQESVNTEFSGFDDSDRSELSFVIPTAKPLVLNSKDWNDFMPIQNENSSVNWSNCSNCSKQSENSFIEPSPPKRAKTPLKVLTNVTNIYETNSNHSVIKNLFNGDNKENIYPSATPKKLYENHYSSNLSPDLFSDDDSLTTAALSLRRKSLEKKKEVYCSKDIKLLKRVQSGLSGVHPPPSLTMVQMTATEMLEKLDKNKDYFWTSQEQSSSGSSLLVSSKAEDTNEKWPKILQVRYYGLHYNRNKISEDFEHLCSRYAERYIGLETQSTCVAFDSDESTSFKRKFSKPRWAAKSPGRRLSHLARRRITFSSSSLQSASSSAILGSRTRQILVDAKKLSVLNKKSPRKTPSKSPFKFRKGTPSSSAKKKLALKFRQMSGEFEATTSSNSSNRSFQSLKRTLFMSPSSDKSASFSGGVLEKKSTKRALFSSPRKNSPQKFLDRKRKRSENDDENSCKLSRSMSFDVNPTKSQVKPLFNRTFSEATLRSNNSKPEELSEAHKKKLQWVVYESLRLQNITATHPQFKVFASVLARVTRRFLSTTPSLRIEGRTTEKMFRIARHHSYAVVKGKSVDEIVNEYTKNKLKNQKPHGYVGIEEFNNMQRENSSNVLQDKANILDNSGSQKESIANKTRLVSRNRIEQIKKVISFEEKFN